MDRRNGRWSVGHDQQSSFPGSQLRCEGPGSRFRQVFPDTPAFVSAVRLRGGGVAISDFPPSGEPGHQSMFLVPEEVSCRELMRCVRQASSAAPAAWVGLKMNEGAAVDFEYFLDEVQGFWFTCGAQAGLDESVLESLEAIRQCEQWDGLVFGGLILGQCAGDELAVSAVRLSRHVNAVILDLPVQSRSHVRCVRAVRDALGDFPLLVAGGVSLARADGLGALVDGIIAPGCAA